MERLGFGNMYVHIATFLLFCMASFWIFNLAAINIDNETVREALVLTGVILCAFVLLYGGFWRIQIRKRFNSPTYTFCFGKPAVTDCTLWLCCWWCSLAQEVRTGNSYDIVEDKFYRKDMDSNNHLQPSPHEDVSSTSSPLGNNHSSSKTLIANSPSPSRVSNVYYNPDRQISTVKEESSTEAKDKTMTPPSLSLIEREAA
ncbi:hypothetical protein P3X46_014457 [Hevea brasiliensis]|uniref:Uncharacterized protein n=1 Tax=Hevea brasiliensis TaxID=3981 RepID=A0ABQ9MAM4_HEVBR|nr:uncharacterized protein LOC110656439 [Hevea brasiliensis]KAJ9175958.1 hypothetical protein P3X46_014457 [Hevea brasiliensis]